jgi:putative FmdB family regulatory protein
MPIYEYACTACGERTEARQGFDDPPLEECPICGGRLRKLYSPVGIVFKGSGFYATDSKSSSKGDGGKQPSGKKSESQDSDSKSKTSDSKPASSGDSSGSGSSSSSSEKSA